MWRPDVKAWCEGLLNNRSLWRPPVGLRAGWGLSVMNNIFLTMVSSLKNGQKIRTRHDSNSDSDSDHETYMNNDNCPRYLVMTSARGESHLLARCLPFLYRRLSDQLPEPWKVSEIEGWLLSCGKQSKGTNNNSSENCEGFVDRPVCVRICKIVIM